jgi:pheromone a factor receptor
MASNTTTTVDLSKLPRVPTTAHAIIMPIVALTGIIILIVPLIFHWRARNTGAWALIGYLIVFNFFVFINVLIWPDENYVDWWNGTGLCDIEVKLLWPITIGIAAATMSITRSLAIVLDVDRSDINPTKSQRRRKLLIDLAICFGLPIIVIGLLYIVQVNRYYILAIGGCIDAYDNSWPTIVIAYIWPLVLVLINLVYASQSPFFLLSVPSC